MLIRAIFVSVLIHLAILLSQTRFDALSRPILAGHAVNALNVRLAVHGKGELLFPGKIDAKSELSDQQGGLPYKREVTHSNVARLLPPTVPLARSGKADSVRAPEATSSEAQTVSAEALGQYRLNVARYARQFKVYPSQARENVWEGVVHVLIAMPIGFGSPVVSLGRSSGHAVLDRQALDMVEQAVSLAMLPEDMRGRSWTVSLPVEYRLAD
jgi:TonB family protein